MNALLQAARMGIALEGATLYCTMTPCRDCTMCIKQAGIVRVVCLKKYHQGAISEEFFRQAKIELVFKDTAVVEYPE
jgi:dCMP deaminase